MTSTPHQSSTSPCISMVAGETSGDLLAGLLLKGLQAELPAQVQYTGVGGTKMQAQGFKSLWPMETLSVNGLIEVIPHIPAILGLRKAIRQQLLAQPPLAFIGVDAPDFNFGLEKPLKAAGIPVVHFVSPSIWAWRGGRIHGIKKAVDHVLCLFPFEPEIYAKEGIAATFVGHPLADVIPLVPDVAGARAKLGLVDVSRKIVAVLPGSRRGEVKRLSPVFFAAMRQMQAQDASLQFVLPLASPALRELLADLLNAYADLNLTITDGGSHTAMEAADVILLASGTATLEAALYKKPMVISYKVPWLTGQIMKRQGYLPYVGLPNILSGRFVVPELLQDAATPDALAQATLTWLRDPQASAVLAENFTAMHHSLKRDTAQVAAKVVADLLRSRGRYPV